MGIRPIRAKMQRVEDMEVTKTFTNAQVKALRASPQTLIKAPGAGWAIVVDRVFACSSAAAGAWTETADNLVVEYSGGTDIITIETTGFLDQASVQVRTQENVATVTTPVINEAVQLFNNGDGEFGGGNVANTFTITLSYRIMKAA